MPLILRRLLLTLGFAVVAALGAGRLGLLEGRPPTDLGVVDGRLKPPAVTPNSVSSQAALHPGHPRQQSAAIEPLQPLDGDRDGTATLAALKSIVEATPGAVLVTADGPYLYARFTSRWLRFVDDTEFWYDAERRVIQVRSASRLGESDLGANRARIESIRVQLRQRTN